MCWRPAIVPTVGVRFLPGFKNEEPPKDEGWKERWNAGEIRDVHIRWNDRGDVRGYFSYSFAPPPDIPTPTLIWIPREWIGAAYERVMEAARRTYPNFVVAVTDVNSHETWLQLIARLDEMGLRYRFDGKRLHLEGEQTYASV